MTAIAHRHRRPELMDDPALDPATHRRALRGLARLNTVSGSARLVWSALRDLVVPADGALRVLDVATGGGDVVLALRRRAERAALPLVVDGCDVSRVALEEARAQATTSGGGGAPAPRFFALDALRDPLPGDYDVLTCSLFLHHLSDEDAATLLRRLAGAARRRVVVNDLARSAANLTLVRLAAALVSRSTVVHVDAARSVRAAFTVPELRGLAAAAGLDGAVVRSRPPCRLLLSWDRS